MSISIKDVVAITGTPGLFKVIKSDDKSLIVESIDERKKRQLVRGNMMASKLADVSIYTEDDSEPLVNILKSMKEKFDTSLPVTKKSSNRELMDFLEVVLPNYDKEKVYPSNVKKLIGWFDIIEKYEIDLNIEDEAPEIEEETETPEAEAPKEELEKPPKKAPKKKAEKKETLEPEAEKKSPKKSSGKKTQKSK